MRPKLPHAYARGFSLVSALFLLVVLSALGAVMVSLSATQHHTTMLGLQGAKAYHAARAGAEWGAYQVSNGAPGACPASFTLGSGALSGFNVAVACASTPHFEQGTDYTAWVITSTASFGNPGDPSYARRQVQSKLVVEQ